MSQAQKEHMNEGEQKPSSEGQQKPFCYGVKKLLNLSVSPWIALLVAIVLCVATIGSVFSTYHGAASTMQRILLEKGASLIRSFEAGARMRMRHASDIRLQLLLEEMASQSDIHFTAVIGREGLILAHSDPALIGTYMMDAAAVASLDALDAPQWKVMTLESEKSFVVYEDFNPLPEMGRGPDEGERNKEGVQDSEANEQDGRMRRRNNQEGHGGGHGGHGLPDRPKEFWDTITTLRSTNTDGAIMLVGLSVEPLQAAKAQDQRMRTLIFLLLLGSALLSAVALWRFQRERQALEKERQAQIKERQAQLKEQQAQEQVRQLEAEIRQREKQAAMGHLAAGVAHELRNPLSSIKGYATYFGSRFPEGSEDRHAAGIMVQEVDRLNRVITDLINLAKPSDLRLITHSGDEACQLVDRALRLIQHEAKARSVQLHFHCDSDLPTVNLDPDRFLQALLNVWLNALDAFKDVPSDHERALYVHISTAPNGKLCVTTRDTGSGIAPDQLSKICDPYFTTKPQGTGLGLAIVQKIIEAHGGRMDVQSEMGEGTTVEFVM